MLVDARTLPDDSVIETDVCIAGAGPAGITLARELAVDSRVNATLVESGGLDFEPDAQALYRGESIGFDYWPLAASRIRFFGGTSNHWGGTCLPLSEDDFAERAWVPDSGWPFGPNELEPYYEPAKAILELPAERFEPAAETMKRLGNLLSDGRLSAGRRLKSPPTRFGHRYREDLARARNIHVLLHANVVDVETDENARQARSIHARTLTGRRARIDARHFILALGGIENARVLLLANGVQASGLGNDNDLVGRYFADHEYFSNVAALVVDRPDGIASEPGARQSPDYWLSTTPATRRERELLNVRMHLAPSMWSRVFRGVRGLSRIRRDLEEGNIPKGFFSALARSAQDLEAVLDAARSNFEGVELYSVGLWTEPVPMPESRVRLGTDLDALGQRRAVLDWQRSEQEKVSAVESLRILAAEVGRTGIGRLRLRMNDVSPWPWDGGRTPGLHHMGTTRMHVDSKRGVVDSNGRVHGIDNLYLAGSSVFPTYGHANPTFTIIAMTLRLAEHLRGNLS